MRVGSAARMAVLAVDKATVFVKIGSFGYVRGDDGVILMNFGGIIDLNGEEHGDAVFFQLA